MLSIITNFGCDEGCSYCVWNQHFLRDTVSGVETTDWQKLFRIINQHSPNRVSISGGGDPLFALENNIQWWQQLFLNLPYVLLDLHTAKIAPPNFARKFDKYVFHAKDLRTYYQQAGALARLPVSKKRVVIVADPEYAERDYIKVAQDAKNRGFSFAIRQLVESKRPINIKVDFLRNSPDLFYIEHGDYNLYFMPDNHVYTKFLEENSRVEI